MTDDKGDSTSVDHVLDLSRSTDHDPQFEPIITLPEVPVCTNEEDEIEMIKLRAKMFRYDSTEMPHEWKERGTGDIKLLRHSTKNCVRVVMRRDKTLKICANHFITPWMELKPNCGSDRAWVYSVAADFTDEEIRSELLAVKFANAENARKWKDSFEEAKIIVETQCELYCSESKKPVDDEDTESEGSESEEEDPPKDRSLPSEDQLTGDLSKLAVSGDRTVPAISGERTVPAVSGERTAQIESEKHTVPVVSEEQNVPAE